MGHREIPPNKQTSKERDYNKYFIKGPWDVLIPLGSNNHTIK